MASAAAQDQPSLDLALRTQDATDAYSIEAATSSQPTDEAGQSDDSDTKAVVRLPRRSSGHLPSDLRLEASSSLFLGALLEDFARVTRCKWWPWHEATQYSDLAGGLIGRAHIAAHAGTVAAVMRDAALAKQSEVAHGEALHSLKKYMTESHPGSSAVSLILVAAGLASFSLSTNAFGLPTGSPQTPGVVPAWEAHFRGIGAIMEHADPRVFARGLGAEVLFNSIPRFMWFALRDRKGLFLDRPEWQYILQHVRNVPFRATIWHIAVQVPGLLQRLDILSTAIRESSSEEVRLKRLRLLRIVAANIRRLNKNLDAWLSDYAVMTGHSTSQPFYERFQSPSVDSSIDKLFFQIHFKSYDAAEIHMLYWTYKLILATAETQTRRAIAMSSSTTDYIMRVLPQKHGKEFAELICQSRDYWFESSAIRKEAPADALHTCWTFPLRLAAEWFALTPAHVPELRYCFDASEKMRKSHIQGYISGYFIDLAYGPVARLLEDLKTELQVHGEHRAIHN